MGQFFEELKRRNVFRVAVAYVISGWLVLQVADIVLEGIGAPDWVMKALLLFGALGFPFVLLFSWAYEFTPEGLKRESDVDRSQSITTDTGRKLNIATIGMLVAVLAVVVLDRLYFHDEHGVAAPIAGAPAEKSIAVLAFDDLSAEGDQAYFAEGLSEELLNVLAQVGDLQVAGRTSSFAFKGEKKDLREIGELLNVAHILEGSVRRAGNRIRVTAQLIKTSDGFHLFSETYDRELSDVFALQDEIAQEISNALLSEIVGTKAITATRTDTEAYELYLLARQRIHTRDIVQLREADAMLTRALEIDSLYAPALAQKALVTHLMSDGMGSYGDTPTAVAAPIAMRLVDQALAIDDKLADAHAVKGLLLEGAGRPEEAIAPIEQALKLNPTMSDAANWMALSLYALGRANEAAAVLEKVVVRDPTYGPAFGNLAMDYMRTGNFDKADALVDRVSHIVGGNYDVIQARGANAAMRGQPAETVKLLKSVLAENPNDSVAQFFYGVGLEGVADYETLAEEGTIEQRMIGYAEHGRMEEALQVMNDMDLNAVFVSRAVNFAGYMLNASGQSQAYIDYVLDRFGSLDTLLRDHDVEENWGVGYLPELAYAYRETGDEETFEMLLSLTHEAIESDRARGNVNWVSQFGEALYSALIGDVDATIEAIETAFDGGYRYARGLDSAVFSSLIGEPRFEAVQKRLADYVDEERAKLGMPPYRPVSTTEEERPAFVH